MSNRKDRLRRDLIYIAFFVLSCLIYWAFYSERFDIEPEDDNIIKILHEIDQCAWIFLLLVWIELKITSRKLGNMHIERKTFNSVLYPIFLLILVAFLIICEIQYLIVYRLLPAGNLSSDILHTYNPVRSYIRLYLPNISLCFFSAEITEHNYAKKAE